jgi:hypothetical protein
MGAPRRPPRSQDAPPITVTARASRKGAEALRLRIERLAARLGVPVTAVTLRRVSRR